MKRILVLLVVTLSLGAYSQNNTYLDKNKCYITAQDFVKMKLKFPKEAKFDKNVVHETNGYGSAIVLGKVTAKNGFGVMSEYVYKIWINHNGRDWTDIDNWSMERLILEDSSTKKQQVFDNRVKPQNDTNVRNAGKIDGIECAVIENNNNFTRITTSRKMTESQIKKAAPILKISTPLIYFHLPNQKARGEEYAMKNRDLILIY